jgi:hypothetical protein
MNWRRKGYEVYYYSDEMKRRRRVEPLRPEVLAVMRAAPANLQPCRKFRRVNAAKFLEHVKEGKCRECSAFFERLDREQGMMESLRNSRN